MDLWSIWVAEHGCSCWAARIRTCTVLVWMWECFFLEHFHFWPALIIHQISNRRSTFLEMFFYINLVKYSIVVFKSSVDNMYVFYVRICQVSPTLSKFLWHRPPAAHIHAIFLTIINFIMYIPGTVEVGSRLSVMSPRLCFCNVYRRKAFLVSARRIYTISPPHLSSFSSPSSLHIRKHLLLLYDPPHYSLPQKPLYNFFLLTGGGLLSIIYSILLKHKSPYLQLPPTPPRHNPSIRASRHSPGVLFPSGLSIWGGQQHLVSSLRGL